jgi:hypothetical protein
MFVNQALIALKNESWPETMRLKQICTKEFLCGEFRLDIVHKLLPMPFHLQFQLARKAINFRKVFIKE